MIYEELIKHSSASRALEMLLERPKRPPPLEMWQTMNFPVQKEILAARMQSSNSRRFIKDPSDWTLSYNLTYWF